MKTSFFLLQISKNYLQYKEKYFILNEEHVIDFV